MKIVRVAIALLVFNVFLAAWPSMAQDTSGSCTQDSVNLAIAAMAKAAQDAQAAKDPKAAVEILAAASAKITALQADCNGLSFSGNTNSVIGPIELPKGIYKSIADTTGFLSATITAVDGDCHQGAGDFGSPMLYMLTDKASNAQSVINSKGCTALIEVTTVQAEWSLRIEKIK
jgi:hypothetical protein